jgi:hypothetical protein
MISSSSGATAVGETGWLTNKSFSEELLPPPAPVAQVFAAAQLLESSDDEASGVDGIAKEEHATSSYREQPLVPDVIESREDSAGDAAVAEPELVSVKNVKCEEVDRHKETRTKHKRSRKHRCTDDISSDDSSRERRHWKRRKDKEKQKEKAMAEAASMERFRVPAGTERKAAVKTWVEETPPSQDYYFDSKGDRDNLAFGSLYR